jgi:WD40 repeat protein
MHKKAIVDVEVIMREITSTKETVKETIRYWQKILDELDRRAEEYEEIYKNMKESEEEDKRVRDLVELNIKLNLRGQVFDTTKDILVKNSTYLSLLLSSPSFELDVNGEFFIDRNSHCFDRILEYMSTGKLSTEGLNSYDKDCLYDNLKYFVVLHTREWDFSKVSPIENLHLYMFLQVEDGRLCGSNNYDIVIYNMDTNKMDMILEGRTDTVIEVIQLKDGRICSCSRDESVKVWNIESGQCEMTLFGHNGCVNCVLLLLDGRLCSGSKICSCSNDKTIKVWNSDTGACERTMVGHTKYVNCIISLLDGRICSVSDDGTLKIWNTDTGVCDLSSHVAKYALYRVLQLHDGRLLACDKNAVYIIGA